MFRLNLCAGLPVIAVRNEKPKKHFRHNPEMVPTWSFQEHTRVVPYKIAESPHRILMHVIGGLGDFFMPRAIISICRIP